MSISDFVGTWNTRRYRDGELPEDIILTITEDATTDGWLDGRYPVTGMDGRLSGTCGSGSLWIGDYVSKDGSRDYVGKFKFLLEAGSDTLVGTWRRLSDPTLMELTNLWTGTRVR